MEIFDEQTYTKLSEEYERALDLSPMGSLMRAISGKMPFSLEKKAQEDTRLERAGALNQALINMLEPLKGHRVEVVRDLLERNKKDLPAVQCEEILKISRFENPYIKVAHALVSEIEKQEPATMSLLARSYCILSATFSL